MIEKKNFSRTIKTWGIFLISGVAVTIAVMDIVSSYQHFRHDSQQIRKNYISTHKEMIKLEVKQVVDLISYKKSQAEELTKKQIRSRVVQAYDIAKNIYKENKGVKSIQEIQKMILDALRPIRFAKGSGYYFATGLDGVEILFADKPEIEGRNMLDLVDSKGKFVTRDLIEIVARSGEGFYEYHWTKPGEKGRDYKKISFVKLFEPLNCLIGTGLYVDDIDNQIQAELLQVVSRIRFGREGYVFINRFNGDALVSNGRIFSGKKKLWEEFDKDPVKMRAIFDKEYKAAITPDGDYIYYSHIKLTTPDIESPKASFIFGIPELQWLVGAGVYLDDAEADIEVMLTELKGEIKKKILYSSIVTLLVLLVFLYIFRLLRGKIANDTEMLSSFFKQAALSNEPINRDLVHFEELDRMAESANMMLEDKKQAKKQLEMFKAFADSSNQGMGWADRNGSIEYGNPALVALLEEESLNSIIGKNVGSEYYPEEEQKRINNTIFPTVASSGHWSGELQLRTATGNLIPTHNSLFLIRDETSGEQYYANIVSDITELKIAEKDKANLARKLQVAQKMESIGLIAGGVAHDLNNILSGITGYPELILGDLPKDSKLRSFVEAIGQSGRRAAAIVDDLLTVARGAAYARKIHDLNSLVQNYLESPEFKKLKSLHPGVSCNYLFEAANGGVLCSPVQVQKTLMNLVTNGFEAVGDNGTVTITTSNQQVDTESAASLEMIAGSYVVLEVQDNGPGISEMDLEHIFEPFYTKKTMGKSGTGLGLTVVWNTMVDHDGKVSVKSGETGSCFKLFFPLTTSGTQSLKEKDSEGIISGDNQHILVIDDEPQLREIGCQMLRKLGYRVDSVDSGEAAIEFIRDQPVDLMLIDMLMEPGINGRETYMEALKLYPGQRAVIASGFSKSDDVTAMLEAGAAKFVKKPYSLELLSRAIGEALRG